MLDPILTRSIDAAERILVRKAAVGMVTDRAGGWPEPLAMPPLDWDLLPWLLGRGGRPVPRFMERNVWPGVELLALLGAGDDDAAMAYRTTQRFADSVSLSRYGTQSTIERVVDHILATGDLLDGAVPMLALSRRADALLDVRPFSHAPAVVGELVIRGRDAGSLHERAEARWATLGTPPWYHGAGSPIEDVAIRFTARTDMDHALSLLGHWTEPRLLFPLRHGPEAVIGRLIVSDPPRAMEAVSQVRDLRRRIARSRHLLRWGVMPDAAIPFFEALLARRNHHIDLALAGPFATLDDSAWLDRAWPGVTRKRPLAIATTFAPSLRLLRDRGHGDRAEALRARLEPVLVAGVPEREFAPIDLLDAFSAPGMPWGTPFGFGLP